MATTNGTVSIKKEGDTALNDEQIEDLCNAFDSIGSNGEGNIQLGDLHTAFEVVGIKLPQYRIRDLISERCRGMGPPSALTMAEFRELYAKIKYELDPKFKEKIKHAQNVQHIQGMSEASNYDILHTVRNEEQVAFSNWINSNLISDADLAQLLPLTPFGDDVYTKVSDGRILCKLINLAVPETIDERAINKKQMNPYTRIENVTLALNSARAIGVNIVNIDADDIIKGKQHLVLGLLWQIIRIGLFREITLVHVPGLVRLLQEGETLMDLQRLSPEQILLRWVNYHLAKAGVERRLTNFTNDVVDSEIYTYLLKEIAPADRAVTTDPLNITGDNVRRGEMMLKEADKLGCRAFVTANDVANGVYKLNLAFVANLFNTWPALKPPGADEVASGELPVVDLETIEEETREERTYRNWMNSMGVDPFVNWLYADLCNAIVIFQLYDTIKAGHVDWKRVVRKFKKFGGMMDQIQNCNYAIDLGKKMGFSLVGIQGKDIYDGNTTLTLALVWQLMRSYTLTLLAHCTKGDHLATDKEIIDWANMKLKAAGKQATVSSFQDPRLSDANAIIDLIDAIQPNVIDYSIVRNAFTNEDKLANAKYAITTARKIGAKVYALPEDIIEVKPKMLLTVFACLMARDYQPRAVDLSTAAPAPTMYSISSPFQGTNNEVGTAPPKSKAPPPVPAKPARPCPVPNGHHNEHDRVVTNEKKEEEGGFLSVQLAGSGPASNQVEQSIPSAPIGYTVAAETEAEEDSFRSLEQVGLDRAPKQAAPAVETAPIGSTESNSLLVAIDELQVIIDQDEDFSPPPERTAHLHSLKTTDDKRLENEPLLVPLVKPEVEDNMSEGSDHENEWT